MALADDIEFYGRAVDAGDMARSDAVQALTEASGGGLTELGAGTAIDDWKTARSTYQAARRSAARGWARSNGLDL